MPNVFENVVPGSISPASNVSLVTRSTAGAITMNPSQPSTATETNVQRHHFTGVPVKSASPPATPAISRPLFRLVSVRCSVCIAAHHLRLR